MRHPLHAPVIRVLTQKLFKGTASAAMINNPGIMLSSPMNYLLPGLLFSCGGWVMPGGKWIVPMTKTFYSVLSKVQGIYTLITAVWPIADIDSFMEVTGPKTDVWLVKTVAAILIPVGLCFIFASKVKRDFWLIFLLGITTTSALATID